MIPVTTLRPFTRMLMTIGQIPTSYLISMTYEEQLLWLCNYLEKTVIPAINNNAEAVKELQDLFVELKSYVDNYFDNLDVQEEINNKLDEMATSGVLQEIVADYLDTKAIFGFDNVSDMKNATNLIDGSFAKTLGFHSINDGGSALYKIRTITNDDIVNEMNIIALSDNSLIAELINSKEINAKQYGTYGDGVHDDYTAIQFAIDDNPLKTIYLPEGTYLISNYIKIYGANDYLVNLKLDTNTVIKTNSILEQLILIGDYSKGSYDRFAENNYMIMEGGILDCNNVTQGILAISPLTKIRDVHFNNITNYGLVIGNSTNSTDIKVNGCNFTGIGSSTSEICTAVKVVTNDNEFNHIRIDATKVGFDVNGGGNYFNDIHATAIFHNNYDYYNNTLAFDISSANNFFNLCYADTYHIGFNVTTNSANFFTECFTYWYYSTTNTEAICFNLTESNPTIHIANSRLTVPDTGTNHILKLANKYAINNLNLNNSIKLINNKYTQNATTSITDVAFEMTTNNETGKQIFWPDNTLTANSLYYIGTIKESNSLYSFDINTNISFKTHVILAYKHNYAELKSRTAYFNNGANTYTIVLGDEFTDSTGNYYINMYLKCSANLGSNVSISNISKCGNTSIFTKINTPTVVTPSTTLATLTIS